MEIKRTKEFNLAYRFITETNQNVFLTGKAGTGKTTFLKFLRQNSLKKSVVAAPTGVAAINAHGVTLHSLFQLPFGFIPPGINMGFGVNIPVRNHPLLSKIHYSKEKLNLLQSLELLIIDEASMVASYTVDAIDTLLRYIRRRPQESFGGVQILFIGDLHQLPPVVKNEEWEILKEFYSSIFFFDSNILRENIPVIIELKEIFRQKDEKFIEILNGIRNNTISAEDFSILYTRIKRDFIPGDNEGYITLTTHNYQADEINFRKLNFLHGRSCTFQAEINGEFPEHFFPAERELLLKTGAQVMFLKNDTEGKKYFNGKIGIVTKLNDECIKVKCENENYEIEVKPSEWQNISYKIKPDTKEITEEILGTFSQYPLRLAWAITIHKSQGLTFDKIIINAERAFAKGQVYVALSRCTSLDGLVLKGPVYRNFLGAHKDFEDWEKKNKDANLSDKLIEARQRFILQEIQNIFSWKNLYDKLMDLKKLLLEDQENINIESISWVTALISEEKKLYEVSKKFQEVISGLSKKNESLEENSILQKRLKDGANYFYDELIKWEVQFLNHPLEAGTRKSAKKVDELLGQINLELDEIQQKIKYCGNGFSLNDYLQLRKSLTSKAKIIRSSYSKKKIVKGSSVLETINLFRKGISIELIAKERNLVPGTIESHLAKGIVEGLIQIEEIMPREEAEKIAKYFPQNPEEVQLSIIKIKIPDDVTYGKLRMVSAWLSTRR
ncbi:MAG TPA: helix-turn-helix domain-containing protein [Ignavibacteriaceae bacterium]|nr:helix-turn-helix domain-containing protein [Ignavibacteriaceae bacterium]